MKESNLTPFFIIFNGDIMVDYKVIKENLNKIDKSTILVLKDNAYNCGILKVLKIAHTLGFRNYAVVSKLEALTIINEHKDVNVLILGKEKLLHNQAILTVEDELDYSFCINYNARYHVKIKSKMNRFGAEIPNDFYNHKLCE